MAPPLVDACRGLLQSMMQGLRPSAPALQRPRDMVSLPPPRNHTCGRHVGTRPAACSCGMVPPWCPSQTTPPHLRVPAGGALQARGGAVWHRLPHLQRRRVRPVCHGRGQHGRRLHPGHRQAADQGARVRVGAQESLALLKQEDMAPCAGRRAPTHARADGVPHLLPSPTPQVPPTMRFVMDGKMPDYLHAKDLILQVGGCSTVCLQRFCCLHSLSFLPFWVRAAARGPNAGFALVPATTPQ